MPLTELSVCQPAYKVFPRARTFETGFVSPLGRLRMSWDH